MIATTPRSAERDYPRRAASMTVLQLLRECARLDFVRTLLVEDDLALHEVVCNMLQEDLGHDPTCVKTVDEAITAIKAADFDIAIVDWMLGAGTCEPVLAALAAATPPVPAIVYSASSLGRATAERWSVDFLDKPFDVSLLVDKIASSVRDRRSPRPPTLEP